ncbi:MAG TPA: T9SS type A sorting domain-containing protein [Saprospiraceae bacterium]|nr:T9SS type A sorting domain-containing protein [Saprospiraceae bacterium]
MKHILIYLFVMTTCCSLHAQASQHTPTWTDGISCIIYSHCSGCHNDKGIAPFPLMTYEDAFANRFSIAASVQSGSMPPFPASQKKVKYAHDNTLTDHEIDEIVDWVNNFAPFGDLSQEMDTPVFDSEFEMNNPGQVLKMPTYTVNTDKDLYRVFVLPVNNTETKYIESIEIYPGNRDIVHHALVFKDTSDVALQLDAQDPGPGYTLFGGTGSPHADLFAGYVPGQGMTTYPEGFGAQLDPNSKILIQIHYPGYTYNEVDSTQVRLKFSDQPLRNVFTIPALNHGNSLTNGPLFIPAGEKRTFFSQFRAPLNFTVTSVLPHMHLIGSSIKAFGVTPTGDTIHLVDVPEWDFHWQKFYQFEQPVVIPAGTMIYGEASYDNTSDNPENPSNPPVDVSRGEGTNDEMMLVYFNVTPSLPGDQDIIVDTAAHWAHYMDCDEKLTAVTDARYNNLKLFPNPVRQQLFYDFSQVEGTFSLELLTSEGTVVDRHQAIGLKGRIDVGHLSPGVYFAKVQDKAGQIAYKKLVIVK